MAAGWAVEDPLEEAFLETPVCVSVVRVVVHLLQVAHQLNVWVSVFFVVDAPGGGWSGTPSWLSLLFVAIALAMLWTLEALVRRLVTTFLGPVARFRALGTIAGLLGLKSADTWFLLDERKYFSSGDWRVGLGGNVTECSWWSFRIADIAGRWPFFTVVKSSIVGIFCLRADVFVHEFELCPLM